MGIKRASHRSTSHRTDPQSRTLCHAHAQAELFGDGAMQRAILATDDPRAAKALGRQVANFRAEEWDRACYGIVLQVVGCSSVLPTA